jgi:hypothetical protein
MAEVVSSILGDTGVAPAGAGAAPAGEGAAVGAAPTGRDTDADSAVTGEAAQEGGAAASAAAASAAGGSAGGGDDGRGARPGPRGARMPDSCRLFVGNLMCERTSVGEIQAMFQKYGPIVDVSLHRSYGFVQFLNPESVPAAIAGESKTMIGDRRIDPQATATRASRRAGDEDASRGRRDDPRRPPLDRERRERERSPPRGDRRERERSPPRGDRRERESVGSATYPRDVPRTKPLPPPPRDGFVIKVILLGGGQRRFADIVAQEMRRAYVPFCVEMLDGRTLGAALSAAEDNLTRYAVVVGKDGEKTAKISLKMLVDKDKARRGVCPTFGESLCRRARVREGWCKACLAGLQVEALVAVCVCLPGPCCLACRVSLALAPR